MYTSSAADRARNRRTENRNGAALSIQQELGARYFRGFHCPPAVRAD